MKRLVGLLVLLIFVLQSFAIEPVNPYNPESNSSFMHENSISIYPPASEYDLSIMNLQLDVLGIVFFGPQVTLDFQFANMIAVGPYFRWHYAGVFYQGIVTDWFSDETTTSIASYSIGGQVKFLIPIGSGQHRPYIEVGFEKSIGSDWWNPEGTWGKRIYEYESNVFHLNAGYRLLTEGSFNLSAAVGIGFSKDTKNIGYYEDGEGDIDYYQLESRVLPMVQLIIGWQLGK